MQCFPCVRNQQNVQGNVLKILADIILNNSTDLKLGRENSEDKL